MITFKVDEDRYLQASGTFPKTRKAALKASIAKWEFIVKFKQEHPRTRLETGGTATCALCQLYNRVDQDGNVCVGCPVSKKSGRPGCENTPYRTCPTLREARAEVAFLKSLEIGGKKS